MPGREDEAVAARPVRVGRVVPHHVAVEEVRERGERHRGAGVAGVRLLHRVHRERANRVDRLRAGVRGHCRRAYREGVSPAVSGDTLGGARRIYPSPVSVLIASNLRKEFSGDPLFDGVSFSVDRGQRLALAGQNGAGKTTLLRAIIGETTIQGGEIALQKGARIALHDQRPPRDRGLTLREYSLSGAADLVRIEQELRELEQAMARGVARRRDDAPLQRGAGAARARRRLELARPRLVGAARPRLPRPRPRPAARDVLGRGADARLARPRSRGRPRPAAARRADEPPRRREPRVARARADDDRRRRRARRPRPLVPRVGDDRGARARGRARPLLLGPLAPVATRAGGPRAGRGEVGAARRGGHRAAGAVRRAVPLQEVEGEAGAGEAHADRRASSRSARRRRASSRTSPSDGARSASSS